MTNPGDSTKSWLVIQTPFNPENSYQTSPMAIPVRDENGEILKYSNEKSFILNREATKIFQNMKHVRSVDAANEGWIPLDIFSLQDQEMILDNETWDAILPRTDVKDGFGNLIGVSKNKKFTLNHGQLRYFGGSQYVLALSTGIGAAGWISLKTFSERDQLIILSKIKNPVATARSSGLELMACYKIKSNYNSSSYLNNLKVVRNTMSREEEPDDYLPKKRGPLQSPTSKAYMNLVYNVPGDSLGGPAVDIFPEGTLFQRVRVPNVEKYLTPSLDVTLYADYNGDGVYNDEFTELDEKGEQKKMKFIYGYVVANGLVRNGWLAIDGLMVTDAPCPLRPEQKTSAQDDDL